MTLSQSERNTIIKGREIGLSYDTIGQLIGKRGDAVRSWYNKARRDAELGEKPIIKKRLWEGTIWREVKSIIQKYPWYGYREIFPLLIAAFPGHNGIPSDTKILEIVTRRS